MARVETTRGAVSLQAAWGAAGRHLAVVSGTLVALVSLVSDAPVSVASVRGAVTCLVIVALTRVGEWLGARTVRVEAPPPTEGVGE